MVATTVSGESRSLGLRRKRKQLTWVVQFTLTMKADSLVHLALDQ